MCPWNRGKSNFKLRGHGQMRALIKALDARRPDTDSAAVLKAA
jgi:hypothetical protein